MTVTARLESAGIVVEPGAQAVVGLTVHNSGHRVDAYHLEVVGEPAAWASVTPAELSVYPGDDGHAQVLFAPPRVAAIPAGSRPFGVRVVPIEHPEDGTVPEGVVELRPFSDFGIELTPRTSHGRSRARHELAVDNRGNAAVPVQLAGGDPDEALVVRVVPADLVVNPGEAAFAKVRVRPAKRRWTGQPVTHPFAVTAVPDGMPPLRADGTMLEEPVLPRWLGKAVAAVLALAVLAAVFWLVLLRPAVKSAAQDAVQAPLAVAAAKASKASSDASTAGDAAGKAKAAADQAGADTGALGKSLVDHGVLKPNQVPPKVHGTPPPSTPPTRPFDRRLTVAMTANNSDTDTYTVEADQVLSITDLIYQNWQGDAGTMIIRVGNRILVQKGLANFRDDADHLVSPIVLKTGQVLTLDVRCTGVGKAAPDTTCRTAVTVSGTLAPTPTA
jgi:hypothetical protein